LKACSLHLGPETVLFSDDLILDHYRLPVPANRYVSRFLKDAVLLATIAPRLNPYRPFLAYALKTIRTTREPEFIKINTFRNVVLKFARFDFIRKHLNRKTVIVDEGLSHIPFNLLNYADDGYAAQIGGYLHRTLSPMKNLLKTIAVIVVVRKQTDVAAYLRNGGHRRIGSRTPYAIGRFLAYNHLLAEEYVHCSDDYFRSRTVFQAGTNGKPKDTGRFAGLLAEVAAS
jgi:hypothetical protein